MVTATLHDWGKIYRSIGEFCTISPASESELANFLKTAYGEKLPVRIRGRGHSMNGASLPRKGEIALVTDQLRHFRVVSKTTIAVGSGASVFAVQDFLRKQGFTLPVYNDGILGPSIGGYVSASGIGTRSAAYGGFWENVAFLRVVDATGNVRQIERTHEDFPWFFGSMGQLGVISEVGLDIIAEKNARFETNEGRIEESWEQTAEAPARRREFETSRLTWFTLIAPTERKNELIADLAKLKAEHANAMRYIPDYTWPIRKRRFTPPLFYPEHRELTCIGIWGYGHPTSADTSEKLLKLNDSVMRLLQQKPYYRRYIQAEPVRHQANWRQFWGETVHDRFADRRKIYNPLGNLNENCIFGCDAAKIAELPDLR